MKHIGKIVAVMILIACVGFCSACIPPFIDGAVEALDYFDEAVNCTTYSINPDAEGGFDTVAGDALSFEKLSDNDEINIEMRHYLSFKFTVKQAITVKTLVFIVEVEENAELRFQLSCGTETSDKSINLDTKKKDIIQFGDLDFSLLASDELFITLNNPVSANVKYRIDTVIFII